MPIRSPRLAVPLLLAASLPATAVLAQTQPQPAPAQPQAKEQGQRQGPRARLSPEARARLLDGRMAMVKETLKLNDAQLKLWAPVEQNIRSRAAERQERRAEMQQRREQGASPPSITERLDRAAERMSKRAERMKAFSDVFKPFYASLDDEQKALARVMLRRHPLGGRGGFHRRWAQNRDPGPKQ